MKRLMFVSSLPLLLVLFNVQNTPPESSYEPALDLSEIIGPVEGAEGEFVWDVPSAEEKSSVFGVRALFPCLYDRTPVFIRGAIHRIQNILPSQERRPALGQPAPVAFMLWFAHLGWYP